MVRSVYTGSFKIDSFSKDIRLPPWEIRGFSIKTTVHKSDTVSVIVGASFRPIAVDLNGIIRFSNALTSVEERLTNLIQESSIRKHGAILKIQNGKDNSVAIF